MKSLDSGWREWECATKQGDRVPVEWANLRLTDDTRIGIGVDLTEYKKIEHELQEANLRLEQRVEERTIQLRAMTAELSNAEDRERQRLAQLLHDELQQLLALAKMRLGMLVPPDDEDRAEFASQIDGIRELMDDAIEQTRSLSRELSPANLRVYGLLKALEQLAEDMHGNYGLEVQLDLDPGAEVKDEGVASTVYRSVRELLFNVVKHSGDGAALIEAKRLEDAVVFSVCDEGDGFDPGEVQKKRQGCESFGLLSIEERIVYLGGRMEMEGAPGDGCCVTLVMPAEVTKQQIAEAGTLEDGAEAVARIVEADLSRAQARDAATIHILLVDDHDLVRESLAGILGEQADFTVAGQAAGGHEAIGLADTLQPDVVVMDISMEGMGGIEATRAIRKQNPGMTVIGLTMQDDAVTRQRMRRAGAVTVLPKSGSLDDLQAAIRENARRG